MGRPPFGSEKEVTTCDICGDKLVIPPGVYYRGEKLHKGCAKIRMQDDIGREVLEPYLDGVEQDLEELLGNMEPIADEDQTTAEKIAIAKAGG